MTITAKQALIALLYSVPSLAADGVAPIPSMYNRLVARARQALVVITPDWNSVSGTLTRFEKISGAWVQVGEKVPVVVGEKGLAWDAVTAVSGSTELIKREGDGRSPAGIFRLTQVFGFDASPISRGMRYLPLTNETECVDDVNSSIYNEIVNRNQIPKPDWNTSEKMRKIEQYKLGIIVGYNRNKVNGAGSCIFLHIWRRPGLGTAGCTAMKETSLRQISDSLDEKGHPILIQLPAVTYERVRKAWLLP